MAPALCPQATVMLEDFCLHDSITEQKVPGALTFRGWLPAPTCPHQAAQKLETNQPLS